MINEIYEKSINGYFISYGRRGTPDHVNIRIIPPGIDYNKPIEIYFDSLPFNQIPGDQFIRSNGDIYEFIFGSDTDLPDIPLVKKVGCNPEIVPSRISDKADRDCLHGYLYPLKDYDLFLFEF